MLNLRPHLPLRSKEDYNFDANPRYRAEEDAKRRVAERIDTLNWALATSRCAGEAMNIRAALEGYESGWIECSDYFTLLYGGHIVDKCSTYQSFCADREERMRRYAAQYGDGWLWWEPPLTGTGDTLLAMKGLSVTQENQSSWKIGHYPAYLRFEIDSTKVMGKAWDDGEPSLRGGGPIASTTASTTKRLLAKLEKRARLKLEVWKQEEVKHSACFKTLADSGATIPMLLERDMDSLGIDLNYYSAQGVSRTVTANGIMNNRFIEMYVSICTPEGESLVGEPASWPHEPRWLGAFLPVGLSDSVPRTYSGSWLSRLSGMLPFDAAYISSAPGQKTLWMGEDRRDVLGANRFPAHLRYDTEKNLEIEYPEDLDAVRKGMKTPDGLLFIHNLGTEAMFVDSELPKNKPKMSEWKYTEFPPGERTKDTTAEIGLHTYESPVKPFWRSHFISPSKIRRINLEAEMYWKKNRSQ